MRGICLSSPFTVVLDLITMSNKEIMGSLKYTLKHTRALLFPRKKEVLCNIYIVLSSCIHILRSPYYATSNTLKHLTYNLIPPKTPLPADMLFPWLIPNAPSRPAPPHHHLSHA